MKKSLVVLYTIFFALALWTATSTAQITFNPAATAIPGPPPPPSFPLLAPLGTAVAPSYSFTGDSDTGMYAAAANTLGFTTNGVAVFAVTTTGAVVTNVSAFAFQNGVVIRQGAGTPEGVVVAPVGSLFLRNNGGAATTLYVKESGVGNTGWIAK
jgi:hypothetical protein